MRLAVGCVVVLSPLESEKRFEKKQLVGDSRRGYKRCSKNRHPTHAGKGGRQEIVFWKQDDWCVLGTGLDGWELGGSPSCVTAKYNV